MSAHKFNKRVMKLKGFFWQVYSALTFRYTKFNTQFLKSELRRLPVKRLHVGCGHVRLPHWLNMAYEKREEYGRIISRDGIFYLNYNLLKPWPIDDGTIDFIAASHFIEHLDLNDGMQFVKNSFRALKLGGVIRLSCPNLELYAKSYAEKNRNFFENPKIREWCTFKNAATFGEIFVAKAYDSGGSHKWFYDFDSLKHILEVAGFKRIEKKTRLEGQAPDLEKIELPERELETVYVEGVKI